MFTASLVTFMACVYDCRCKNLLDNMTAYLVKSLTCFYGKNFMLNKLNFWKHFRFNLLIIIIILKTYIIKLDFINLYIAFI